VAATRKWIGSVDIAQNALALSCYWAGKLKNLSALLAAVYVCGGRIFGGNLA